MRKGSCPVTEEQVATGITATKAILSNAAANPIIQSRTENSANSLTSIKEPNCSTT
jgi:hypothetical protein